MDFFEIFTSGRYHTDMKALRILASNSKHFRIYSISKKMTNWCASDGILNAAFFITSVSNKLWT